MDDCKGKMGDAYLTLIEPLTSGLPFMVAAG